MYLSTPPNIVTHICSNVSQKRYNVLPVADLYADYVAFCAARGVPPAPRKSYTAAARRQLDGYGVYRRGGEVVRGFRGVALANPPPARPTAPPLRDFVRQRLVLQRHGVLPSRAAYGEYCSWCRRYGVTPDGIRVFTRHLRDELRGHATYGVNTAGGRSVRAFSGVQLALLPATLTPAEAATVLEAPVAHVRAHVRAGRLPEVITLESVDTLLDRPGRTAMSRMLYGWLQEVEAAGALRELVAALYAPASEWSAAMLTLQDYAVAYHPDRPAIATLARALV